MKPKNPLELLITELQTLLNRETECRLVIGDKINHIKDYHGMAALRTCLKELHLSYAAARQYMWVSSSTPTPVRQLELSYSHCRTLAGLDNPLKWGQKAKKNQWTVGELKRNICGDNSVKLPRRILCHCCEKAHSGMKGLLVHSVNDTPVAYYCDQECSDAHALSRAAVGLRKAA